MMKLVIQVYDPAPTNVNGVVYLNDEAGHSNIRPPYVNGVVYLNDKAGHSSIRPPMFNHSKTLKLCYITACLKSGVLYFGSVTYS